MSEKRKDGRYWLRASLWYLGLEAVHIGLALWLARDGKREGA